MARMWPSRLPDWVLSDPRRKAEIAVFEKLGSVLDDTWVAFYSRPWWGINARGGEVDGEADFIVVHPDRGFLFLEVKGGGVAFNPERSQWTSRDADRITHNIKDPVQQALSCKHRYIDRLRQVPGWPRSFIRFRHGVVLPDSLRPTAGTLSFGGYDLQLFCFVDTFAARFGEWIEGRLAAHEATAAHPEVAPGAVAVEILRKLVAEPISLRVPLQRAVHGELAAQESLLTGHQLAVISMLEETPRALIEGGAGTGKTLVAMEMAARLADEGQSVLLLCYNEPLAAELARRLHDRPAVTVATFHSLCRSLVGEAGLTGDTSRRDYFDVVLPESAVRALETLALRWDSVIVDEGQDFLPDWWSVVEGLLREPESGRLRVFFDSNQTVYTRKDDLETRLRMQAFPLRINLRNTKCIARVADLLHSGVRISAAGPEGEHPHDVECASASALSPVVERVLDLTRNESCAPSDIAVLLPNYAAAQAAAVALRGVGIKTCKAGEAGLNCVVVDSIARFKGLEAAVVVLVVDGVAANNSETAYVAVTRARSRLFVIGTVRGTRLGTALERAIQPSAGK